MKRNGFTLIELLAVIVILAIIALIATPIILGIINDARKESNERSVELYASAVRNAIASYQLTNPNAPKTFEDLTIQYEGDVECATEELYSDGSFYIADCTVNDNAVDYTYGTKKVIKGKLSSVCTPVEEQYFADSPLEPGYEYECKVDPNKAPYAFYVLTTPEEGATSVNLIMDSNINISGEAIKDGSLDLGTVAWMEKVDYINKDVGGTVEEWDDEELWTKYGPITAMNYLQTATRNWTNVNTQTISTFTDNAGNTHNIAKTYTANARIPYKSEVSDYSGSTAYLYDNLQCGCSDYEGNQLSCDIAPVVNGVHTEGLEHVDVGGYWTLTTSSTMDSLWINEKGFISDASVNTKISEYEFGIGVRPVINLSI